jgi:hypothetical protein
VTNKDEGEEQTQRPTLESYTTWREYWKAQEGMLWRTEPEIDSERQQYLAERRAIHPEIEGGGAQHARPFPSSSCFGERVDCPRAKLYIGWLQ